MSRLTQSEFEHLLALRTGLRRFLRWSERQSEAAGITPAQHRLLLAIRGHPDPAGPTVGEIADYLVLRHHSAVGLIDRAEAAGLVKRTPDPANNRIVRLALTQSGIDKLDGLTDSHREELAHLANTMRTLRQGLERSRRSSPHQDPRAAISPRSAASTTHDQGERGRAAAIGP
jgi:DNA-binding MarR family transcriptional regulator